MAKIPALVIRWTALVLLMSTPALAQQPSEPASPPVSKRVERHVHNYGDLDRTCTHWTDRCRACSRGADGAPNCSNIGIVCAPAEVECSARREDAEKKWFSNSLSRPKRGAEQWRGDPRYPGRNRLFWVHGTFLRRMWSW